MRTRNTALACALVLGIGGAASADTIMINNGLAPPNPANVIDDGTYDDDVYVRNVGCPPGWPSGSPGDPCSSPGDPTEVSVVTGGAVGSISAYDSSTVTNSGGTAWLGASVHDSATISLSGGATYGLTAYDSSTSIISGGGMSYAGVRAYNSSTINMSGGSVNFLHVYDTSGVSISGGGVGEAGLQSFDHSTVTMSDGSGFFALAQDFSALDFSGGVLGQGLMSQGSATVTMSGGEVGPHGPPYGGLSRLTASGNSTFIMSGGTLGTEDPGWYFGILSAHDSASFTLSGGMLLGNTWIEAEDSSLIKIVGNAFAVDGAPVAYGNLIALNGVLTGMLANGGSLNNLFYQGGGSHTGTIRLVPEPSTAVLLGAGLLGLLTLTRRLAARRAP